MNGDDELSALRAQRIAEMKANSGGLPAGLSPMGPRGGSGGAGGAGGQNGGDQEKAQQMDEMRRSMLAQILSPEARERLARIRIVKEDKARGVEEMLIRMAQTGQIRGKVSEAALIDILGQVNESVASAASSKIKFTRRAADVDSDEELLAQLM